MIAKNKMFFPTELRLASFRSVVINIHVALTKHDSHWPLKAD